MTNLQASELARYIDHTNLRPEVTPDDIHQLCKEAVSYGFYAVCVNPIFVPQCSEHLRETGVKVCSVVGFPLGATPTTIKVEETHWVCERGAAEVNMVIAIGLLKAKLYSAVEADIAAVVEAARANNAAVKVILETAMLTDEEKIMACELAKSVGAAFVKTSTGFSKAGATIEDVKLMQKAVKAEIGVKASGGIKTLAQAMAMLEAGATRLGTSASVAILEEARRMQA